MRLWSYQLLPYLPKSQLLSQKRECDLILRDRWNGKKTNHILINYIYEYSDIAFTIYYTKLYREFKARGFKFNDRYRVVNDLLDNDICCFNRHHNKEYLTICYYNLKEKYLRGQKDFTKDVWEKLDKFYKEKCEV